MARPGHPRFTPRARGLLLLLAVLVAVWLIAAVFLMLNSPPQQAEAGPQGQPDDQTGRAVSLPRETEDTGPEPAPSMETFYEYDIFDERFVIALSDNVFVGRVIEQTGSEPARSTIPGPEGRRAQVQYSVSVLEVVKASGGAPVRAGKTVTVNRDGGVSRESRLPITVEAVSCGAHATDQQLRANTLYAFSTYHEPSRNLHTLTAQPTGAVPVAGTPEAMAAAYGRAFEQQQNPFARGADPCG